MSHQTDDRRRRRSDDDPATHGAIASSAITCPSARPATCPTCQTRTALSAQQVQHACTTFNRLLGDFFTRKFMQAETRATDVCSFTSSASCFLFLSLPFLSHSFYSPSLFLCLNWVGLGASSFRLLPGFAGPVRSVLLCLPLIFVMYIDNYKREGFLYLSQRTLILFMVRLTCMMTFKIWRFR